MEIGDEEEVVRIEPEPLEAPATPEYTPEPAYVPAPGELVPV